MTVSKPDTKTVWVDPDDAPELTDEWFETADLKVGETVVRRGRPRGRPKGSSKQQVAIRLDQDVIARFKAGGVGWQTRMNDALRDWLKTHSPA